MLIRKLALVATTAVTFVLLPPILPHASAQNNPTVSNIIPEGGHYSIRGKLQGIDPAANTLTLTTDQAGTIPVMIGPQAEGDIAHVSVGDMVDVTYTRTVTFVLASPNVNV